MSVYTIRRMETPDWSVTAAVEMRHTGWLEACPIAARAQACHNGEKIFVRLEAEETAIRATLRERLDQVCNDSCLEFFFAPLKDDPRYFNFEYNPLGTLYLGFGAQRHTRVRQIVAHPEMFEAAPARTEKGWCVEFVIPLSFVRMYFPDAVFEGEAAGNFFKCGDETEKPHYLAWSRPACDTPDFHRRQDFGRLIFE